MTVRVEHGDSRDVLKTLADSSVDSCVTDPPYSLVSIQKRFGKAGSAPAQEGKDGLYRRASAGFMGKTWDTGETAFDPAFWAEVYRVLKPGAHLVAFSGTRTYHRMVCAIEDAGFEIRDQIGWLYGSGFPKSHDVAKQLDKSGGVWRGRVGRALPNKSVAKGTEYERVPKGEAVTDDAKAWEGWGTALKPAWEPIALARKPLDGTVAANVLQHGTGALNIDASRVEAEDAQEGRRRHGGGQNYTPVPDSDPGCRLFGRLRPDVTPSSPAGRWPANVIHDGSEEVLAAFPETVSGTYAASHAMSGRVRDRDFEGSQGSAARFFYSAKADAEDRLGSKHPTVKPVDLIAYLCRLVTPPGGTVLDPFAGSGTTGAACLREGFDCILIEREAEYIPDIMARIELASADGRHPHAIKHRNVDPAKARGEDTPLFAPAQVAAQ